MGTIIQEHYTVNSFALRPKQTTTFQDGFSEEVWASTYKDYKDTDINDSFWRTAIAIASVEKTDELKALWARNFYDLLTDFKVVSGGRILANAGTEFKGTTLINCFAPEVTVMTDCGPKLICDVEIGDLVLTHRGRFKPVVNTMSRLYNGPVQRFHSAYFSGDIISTPEHPYYQGADKWIASTNVKAVALAYSDVPDSNEAFLITPERFDEDYDGYVYNISVEDDESYVVNNVVVHNCFVSPMPKNDADSIQGILATLEQQSLTLKSEGGWGHNFSVLRPRGSFIQGIGVETPGSVKFMELFDKSSEIITSGSGQKSVNGKAKGKIRKGAMMGVLDVWHPDIIEFITAKQTSNRLSKFNVSVNCTDAFMVKVLLVEKMRKEGVPQEDLDAITWDLIFPDTMHAKYKKEWDGNINSWIQKGYATKVYRTVKVEWLWNLIAQSTYNRNEPGILFLDRANYFNQLNYAEVIASTNPCLTGETLVAVADGRNHVSISQLAKEGKDVPVYCYDTKGKLTVRTLRNPRVTGYNKPIYKVTLDDGSLVRATANHKFLLKDGTYKEVHDLLPGDSLKLLVKYQASIREIFEKSNGNSQDYWWLNTGQRQTIGEHRVIAAFSNNTVLKTGQVVHHKDYNALNNTPENLQIMSKQEHDDFHRQDMMGDANPMRRATAEWSEEKWAAYRAKQSKHSAGENNKNYSGVTNEELKQAALTLTRKLGYRFSNKEWQAYALENNLPSQFSKWRNNHLNGMLGFAKWAAIECGFENISCDPRTSKTLKKYLEMGYDCLIDNNIVMFNKTCEYCEQPFINKRREVAYCSLSCSSYGSARKSNYKVKKTLSFQQNIKQRHNTIREQQAKIYSNLKFSLNRLPMKKEWMAICKENKVSAEICRKSSPFKTYQELADYSADYNHKVVLVELDGYENVYNGTVDEFHNFCVGGFESVTASGKLKYSYLNNLQCGEQTLAPSGVCCLGTVNLTQYVKEDQSGFDLSKLRKYTKYLVRFLDNVNSYSDAPLPEYVYSMRNKRRIGCGLMGWGSALLMLKIRFGSEQADALRTELLREFTHAGVEASIDLAEEKGMFTLCQPEKHVLSPYWDNIELPKRLRDRMRVVGIRNSSLFSMQPNGNGGVLANIVTGGIEPVFLAEYTRTVIQSSAPEHLVDVTPRWFEGAWHETKMFKFAKEGDEEILRGKDSDGTVYKIDKNRGLTKEVLCQDYGVRYLTQRGQWNKKAKWVVTTEELSVSEHVNDLKGFAKAVDSACSKTVNLPFDYNFEDFKSIYLDAYTSGFIKGITTYRSGSMTSVLSAVEQKHAEDEEVILTNVKMPDTSRAEVKVLRDYEGGSSRKWYLTMTFNENNAPIGVFVQTNAMEKSVLANDAVDHLIALARTKGIPEKFVVETIDKCHNDSNSTKIARAIGLLLRHGVRIKNIVGTLDKVEGVTFSSFVFHLKKLLSSFIKDGEKIENATCNNCGSSQIVYESGCQRCAQCSNSKCS